MLLKGWKCSSSEPPVQSMVSNYFSRTLAWLHQISAAPYERYSLFAVVSIHKMLARQLVQPIASREGLQKQGLFRTSIYLA